MERHQLDAAQFKKLIDQCSRHGIDAVSLTGGEPFINIDEALRLLEYAGRRGIRYLRSGTNGYMFTPGRSCGDVGGVEQFARALAATGIRNFWISMDSADTETHEAMRGLPGVVEGIRNALPVFHAHGLYPAVNLGINRNISGPTIASLGVSGAVPGDERRFLEAFKKGFANFLSKAIAMGFTMANVCYPMSSEQTGLSGEKPVYGAISDDSLVNFSPLELRLVFRALLEVIPDFRRMIRIFTPLSVLYALSRKDKAPLFPCLGGIRYFFVDSRDGHLYPCGFRGDQDLGGDLDQAIRQAGKAKPFCKKCHWECFADPSQLFGMARYLVRHPIRAFLKKEFGAERFKDPIMLKLWLLDIKYYVHNDFFDGRRPMKER
jgi:MoaA/NifB/PqqE/SkfB family radical SAM enzyme